MNLPSKYRFESDEPDQIKPNQITPTHSNQQGWGGGGGEDGRDVRLRPMVQPPTLSHF